MWGAGSYGRLTCGGCGGSKENRGFASYYPFPIGLPASGCGMGTFGVDAVFVCFLYRDRRPRPRSMPLSGALYS
jgi:hypothetical protein